MLAGLEWRSASWLRSMSWLSTRPTAATASRPAAELVPATAFSPVRRPGLRNISTASVGKALWQPHGVTLWQECQGISRDGPPRQSVLFTIGDVAEVAGFGYRSVISCAPWPPGQGQRRTTRPAGRHASRRRCPTSPCRRTGGWLPPASARCTDRRGRRRRRPARSSCRTVPQAVRTRSTRTSPTQKPSANCGCHCGSAGYA